MWPYQGLPIFRWQLVALRMSCISWETMYMLIDLLEPVVGLVVSFWSWQMRDLRDLCLVQGLALMQKSSFVRIWCMENQRVQATGKDRGMHVDKCSVECRTFGRRDTKNFCKMKGHGLQFGIVPFVLFQHGPSGRTCLALQASRRVSSIVRRTTTSCIPFRTAMRPFSLLWPPVKLPSRDLWLAIGMANTSFRWNHVVAAITIIELLCYRTLMLSNARFIPW